MIVPVYLQSLDDKGKTFASALQDSASNQSFITTSLARRINLDIYSESSIVVNTFGGRAEKRKSKRIITCLYNTEGDGVEVELLTSDQITPPLQVGLIPHQDEVFVREHLLNDEAQRTLHGVSGTAVPEILLGMNYFNTIMKLHKPVDQFPSELFLTPTMFGPILSGVAHDDHEQADNDIGRRGMQTCTAFNFSQNEMDISELWNLVAEEFYSTVEIKDNKIFLRFPWKSNKNRFASISTKYGIEQQPILDKEFQKQLNDNLYVDNVLTDDFIQSLINKYRKSKELFNNMSMNLRQFVSNDDICNKSIKPEDLSTSKSVKILGIPWNR
ncbi:unnamed protein product [Haemonchus placei]|uniref:DUF1758 domain-containing protein n=1 Tax=Haemonchus placei TaxID=6290 RepID=A0A0N4WBW6_HAEPC|nr:unnamed protein product [Haemonchus placei]